MPDTASWNELLAVAHSWGGDGMRVERYDQFDAIMRDWTEPLGLTLDRATLEGGLWAVTLAMALASWNQIEAEGIKVPPDTYEPKVEHLAYGLAVTQYLIVKRIDALEPEQ